MEEIWAEIPGTSGRYSVSTHGRVRANWITVPRRGEPVQRVAEIPKLLSPWVHTTGYWRVSLGRKNKHYVHRLVAAAFVPNPENLPQVDHVDGNRLNANAENLRWVTSKQNVLYGGERHGFESQIASNRAKNKHVKNREVYVQLVSEGWTLRKIAKLYRTSHAVIRKTIGTDVQLLRYNRQ